MTFSVCDDGWGLDQVSVLTSIIWDVCSYRISEIKWVQHICKKDKLSMQD